MVKRKKNESRLDNTAKASVKSKGDQKKSEQVNKSFLLADEQDDQSLKSFSLSDLASFKKLLTYASEYKKGLLMGLFLIMGSSLCALASARLMGKLVEEGLIPADSSSAYRFALGILGLEVSSLIFMWLGRRLISLNSGLSIYAVRLALFEHLQKLPIGFYDRQPQGRVVTRVTHDVEGIENFFTGSLGRLLNSGFMATLAIVAMLVTDFKLGSMLIISILPSLLFIYITRGWVRKANRRLSKASSMLNAKLSEFINGLEVIRSYGLEDWSKQQYDHQVEEYRTGHLKANFLYGWTRPLVSLLCNAPLLVLIWFGGARVLEGSMQVGLFVTFIRYCERFYMPIMNLAREVHVIQQAFTSTERVASFLNHDEEEVSLGKDGTQHVEGLQGEIEFKDLWMAYSGENWVLKGLQFKIETGQKVGLVGTTGCGKTTTVSLLSRLYEFQKGELLIDGQDIRQFERSSLRKNIGFVGQDAIIFKGTLRENLTVNESLRDEEILKACEITGLTKAMAAQNKDLDSLVYDAGANLSVGERQLVALTRVLINNPSILILDEATANIDPWYEALIHKAVDAVMDGRTCLIIAHRLATLESCDQIMVFDQGRLVEKGTREELFSGQGHFAKLHEAAEFSSAD